ncbi:MAG: hypothetical protein J6J35_06565 [Alphaproteobacteria bacterium]|nr:hypothetical protein [Alphaproteobacteria bacterium]
MEKVSFISKLFGFNTKRTSPVKSPEPEYSGPLTFFGTPENQYISGQNEARAAVANAFSQMLAYNEQRKLAINDKAMMCRSDYQAKWQLPMLLYIELNDMVIMFEDYYKIFDYLGLGKLLSSNKFSSAPKSVPKNQGVYGSVDIHLDEKITFKGYFVISQAIPGWDAYSQFATFKCGEFCIFVMPGSRHILIGHLDGMEQWRTYSHDYKALYNNVWVKKRAAFCYSSENKEQTMYMNFIINKNNSREYDVTFKDKKREICYKSREFSHEEFCSLVKSGRQEWRKQFSKMTKEIAFYFCKEYSPLHFTRVNNPLRYSWNIGSTPAGRIGLICNLIDKDYLLPARPLTDVCVKLPDNLLSC